MYFMASTTTVLFQVYLLASIQYSQHVIIEVSLGITADMFTHINLKFQQHESLILEF
jgi:hypothetical protein